VFFFLQPVLFVVGIGEIALAIRWRRVRCPSTPGDGAEP